jgi:hypothetical protein
MASWLRSARSVLVPSGTENGHLPTRFRTRAMAARLSIERLEDRTVPSTFTVGNLADSGAGSLREAVLDANDHPGADLIRVASGVGGTITLTSGELSITDDLILDGPGVNRLTISGNDASRVFSVSGSATDVEIRGLTIAHGQATGTTAVGPLGPVTLGGGLLNIGAHVILSDVSLNNNQAVGHIAQGGAVANVFGATLVVTDSTFAENQAAGTSGSRGGAIANDAASTLVLERGTFTDNQATTVLGTSPGIPGTGLAGAIGNAAGSQATVSYSTFDSNVARGGTGTNGGPGQNGGNGGNGVGGAISNDATSFLVPFTSSTMTVAHATFLGNQAIGGIGGTGGNGGSGGNGSNGPGGAINNGGSTLTVTDSTFLGNQSLGGPGGSGGAGGNGGVGGNGSGGAIQNANPPPALTGGALVRATLHVSDSLFLGNEAIGGAGGNGGSSGNGGAGATGQGGGLINQFADWDIRNTLFAFNQATGGAGGDRGSGGLIGGTGGAGRGGGISNINGSIGTLSDSSVLLNTATGGAGGVGGNGGNGQGGGVFNDGPTALGTPRLTLQRSVAVLNRADGGAAGNGGSAGLGQGGGLYLTPGGDAYADVGTTIFANDASTSDDDVFGNLANFP